MAEMMLVMALIAIVLISLATAFFRLTFEDEFIKYQAEALRNLMYASDQINRYVEKGATAAAFPGSNSVTIAYTNSHMAGASFIFGSERFSGVTQLLVEVSDGSIISTLQSLHGNRRNILIPAQTNNSASYITNNLSASNAPGRVLLELQSYVTRKAGGNTRQTNVVYSQWMLLKNQ